MVQHRLVAIYFATASLADEPLSSLSTDYFIREELLTEHIQIKLDDDDAESRTRNVCGMGRQEHGSRDTAKDCLEMVIDAYVIIVTTEW